MDQWTKALVIERMAWAKKRYAAMEAVGWGNLSPRDRGVFEALGYMSLESDVEPTIEAEMEE